MRLAAAIKRYEKESNPHKRRLIAFDIARYLHDSNKVSREWLLRYAVDRLDGYDTHLSPFKSHLMVGAWMCCASCQEIEGKKFTLDEARNSMPLPQHNCQREVNKAGFAICLCDWEIDMHSVREARSLTLKT